MLDFEEYLNRMIAKGCCTSAIMGQFICNAETLMHINPNESSDDAYYQCLALKTLKELISTSDKWLPILEADICEMEANSSYFAEKKEFEEGWNWGYGNWIDPNDPDVLQYDSLMETNVFRRGKNRKVKQNGKRNADKAKRYHRSDRKHGKFVSQSDKKYWDKQSGTFYRWDEKKEDFLKVHKRRKTFRNRLNARMEERELDFTDSRSLRFAIDKAYKEADNLYKEINKLTSQPVCDFIAPDHSEDKFKEFMNEYSYLCEREKEAWAKASELHDLLWIDED